MHLLVETLQPDYILSLEEKHPAFSHLKQRLQALVTQRQLIIPSTSPRHNPGEIHLPITTVEHVLGLKTDGRLGLSLLTLSQPETTESAGGNCVALQYFIACQPQPALLPEPKALGKVPVDQNDYTAIALYEANPEGIRHHTRSKLKRKIRAALLGLIERRSLVTGSSSINRVNAGKVVEGFYYFTHFLFEESTVFEPKKIEMLARLLIASLGGRSVLEQPFRSTRRDHPLAVLIKDDPVLADSVIDECFEILTEVLAKDRDALINFCLILKSKYMQDYLASTSGGQGPSQLVNYRKQEDKIALIISGLRDKVASESQILRTVLDNIQFDSGNLSWLAKLAADPVLDFLASQGQLGQLVAELQKKLSTAIAQFMATASLQEFEATLSEFQQTANIDLGEVDATALVSARSGNINSLILTNLVADFLDNKRYERLMSEFGGFLEQELRLVPITADSGKEDFVNLFNRLKKIIGSSCLLKLSSTIYNLSKRQQHEAALKQTLLFRSKVRETLIQRLSHLSVANFSDLLEAHDEFQLFLSEEMLELVETAWRVVEDTLLAEAVPAKLQDIPSLQKGLVPSLADLAKSISSYFEQNSGDRYLEWILTERKNELKLTIKNKIKRRLNSASSLLDLKPMLDGFIQMHDQYYGSSPPQTTGKKGQVVEFVLTGFGEAVRELCTQLTTMWIDQSRILPSAGVNNVTQLLDGISNDPYLETLKIIKDGYGFTKDEQPHSDAMQQIINSYVQYAIAHPGFVANWVQFQSPTAKIPSELMSFVTQFRLQVGAAC